MPVSKGHQGIRSISVMAGMHLERVVKFVVCGIRV